MSTELTNKDLIELEAYAKAFLDKVREVRERSEMSAADLRRKKKAEDDARIKAQVRKSMIENKRRVLANHERKMEAEKLKAAQKW